MQVNILILEPDTLIQKELNGFIQRMIAEKKKFVVILAFVNSVAAFWQSFQAGKYQAVILNTDKLGEESSGLLTFA